jgi:hypothetical protein
MMPGAEAESSLRCIYVTIVCRTFACCVVLIDAGFESRNYQLNDAVEAVLMTSFA